MAFLTVFTPAYNRAHTLQRTYESLCRQECKDFLWLIIDDGSTDQTSELVQSWQKKEKMRPDGKCCAGSCGSILTEKLSARI